MADTNPDHLADALAALAAGHHDEPEPHEDSEHDILAVLPSPPVPVQPRAVGAKPAGRPTAPVVGNPPPSRSAAPIPAARPVLSGRPATPTPQARPVISAQSAAPGPRAIAPENVTLRCHFHNTRNTGLANAVAAIEAGVTVLDSSLGGVGGCPFAPNATGNIPTEDLLYLLHRMGYETGVDLEAACETARWLEGIVGHSVPGLLGKAGVFPMPR